MRSLGEKEFILFLATLVELETRVGFVNSRSSSRIVLRRGVGKTEGRGRFWERDVGEIRE